MISVSIVVFTIFLMKGGIAYKDCDGINKYPDYYWRDYNGVLPPDALVGGSDKQGKPTYIGQMFHPKYGLIPSVIYPDSKTLLGAAAGAEHTLTEYAKILCTRSPKKFKWIPTNNSQVHMLTGYHFVIGGAEANHHTHIGRMKLGEEVRPGKVFAFHKEWAGLSVQWGPGTPNYEILVYDYNSC